MSWEQITLWLSRFYRSLWFLPSAYALGSVLVLALAPVLAPLVPAGLLGLVSPDAVEKMLGILTSSMLAVAIFSLGTMVSALHASASSSTPRARVLLTEDRSAQTAISTFIGAFIFSVLGIIGLSTDVYSEASRFIVFVITVVIITVVIAVLISWINRLSKIGGVGEAVDLVEQATQKAFGVVARDPYHGGQQLVSVPSSAEPIYVDAYGYIQHIDGQSLAALCDELGVHLYLVARAGRYVDPSRPIAMAEGNPDDGVRERIAKAFSIGDARTFEEDPRFGLIVLSEIASRALSPAVNDPGTAIDVLSTIVRVLARWRAEVGTTHVEVRCERLHVVGLKMEDVIADAFRWLARDGAGLLEVSIKIQKALATLAQADPGAFKAAVESMSEEAYDRAKQAMASDDDLRILRRLRADLQLA